MDLASILFIKVVISLLCKVSTIGHLTRVFLWKMLKLSCVSKELCTFGELGWKKEISIFPKWENVKQNEREVAAVPCNHTGKELSSIIVMLNQFYSFLIEFGLELA